MRQQLVVNDRLAIPRDEIRFTFARSSGPGGQNVNKVNTKAVLRWRPADCETLPSDVVARLVSQCATRINVAGELVLSSDRFRERPRNVDDCLQRLRALVAAAASPPKRRRPTRRTRSANERRLQSKRRQGDKKASRRRPIDES